MTILNHTQKIAKNANDNDSTKSNANQENAKRKKIQQGFHFFFFPFEGLRPKYLFTHLKITFFFSSILLFWLLCIQFQFSLQVALSFSNATTRNLQNPTFFSLSLLGNAEGNLHLRHMQ